MKECLNDLSKSKAYARGLCSYHSEIQECLCSCLGISDHPKTTWPWQTGQRKQFYASTFSHSAQCDASHWTSLSATAVTIATGTPKDRSSLYDTDLASLNWSRVKCDKHITLQSTSCSSFIWNHSSLCASYMNHHICTERPKDPSIFSTSDCAFHLS